MAVGTEEQEPNSQSTNTKFDPHSTFGTALNDIAQWIALLRLDVPVSAEYDSVPKAVLHVLSGGEHNIFPNKATSKKESSKSKQELETQQKELEKQQIFNMAFSRWYRAVVQAFRNQRH